MLPAVARESEVSDWLSCSMDVHEPSQEYTAAFAEAHGTNYMPTNLSVKLWALRYMDYLPI